MGRKAKLKAARRERTFYDDVYDCYQRGTWNRNWSGISPDGFFADQPIVIRSAFTQPYTQPPDQLYGSILRLPFDRIFIELWGVDRAGICLQSGQGEGVQSNIIFSFTFVHRHNKPLPEPLGFWDIKLDEDYKFIGIDKPDEDVPDSIIWKGARFAVYTWVIEALLIIQLLNMRNVELIDNHPDPKLSAIHEREYGRPLVTYKTLAIKPTRKVYQNEAEHPDDYEATKKRLHIVRGHPRHVEGHPFIPDGTYWIPAHVRGDESLGVVVKDYKVVGNEN